MPPPGGEEASCETECLRSATGRPALTLALPALRASLPLRMGEGKDAEGGEW